MRQSSSILLREISSILSFLSRLISLHPISLRMKFPGQTSPSELRALGLKILALEAEQVLTIETLQIEHLELSPNDLSVYILACQYRSLLISGDGPLRDNCKFEPAVPQCRECFSYVRSGFDHSNLFFIIVDGTA